MAATHSRWSHDRGRRQPGADCNRPSPDRTPPRGRPSPPCHLPRSSHDTDGPHRRSRGRRGDTTTGTMPPAGSTGRSRWAAWFNRWITSRTVSSCGATSRAIAGTGVPDAVMINARRTRTDSACPPHDLLQPAARLIGRPPRPYRLGHQLPSLSTVIDHYQRVRSTRPTQANPGRRVANPVNVRGQRTSRPGRTRANSGPGNAASHGSAPHSVRPDADRAGERGTGVCPGGLAHPNAVASSTVRRLVLDRDREAACVDQLQPCVCCGNRTGCRTCPVCFWTMANGGDNRVGPGSDDPNGGLDLGEARLNFAVYGATRRRYVGLVRPPRADEVP